MRVYENDVTLVISVEPDAQNAWHELKKERSNNIHSNATTTA